MRVALKLCVAPAHMQTSPPVHGRGLLNLLKLEGMDQRDGRHCSSFFHVIPVSLFVHGAAGALGCSFKA